MTYEEKIMSLADAGSGFDQNLITALQMSEEKIITAQGVLTAGGFPELATKLGSFDHGQAELLATHLGVIEPELLDRMMQSSALSDLRRVFDPEPDVGLTEAFGTIFLARLFISSLDNLPVIIAEGATVPYEDGPFGNVDDGGDDEVCCEPTASPEPDEDEEPEAPIETVADKLDARIDEILAVGSGAQAAIDAEIAYFSGIDAQIDRYTKAMMLHQGFSSFPSNLLVSAFASEEVLEILKTPDDR